MRTRERSRVIRRRGLNGSWTTEALPADPWRNYSGADACVASAAHANNWATFGAAPPRDSEPARRSPLPEESTATDPGEHNRQVRRAHRAARQRRGRR